MRAAMVCRKRHRAASLVWLTILIPSCHLLAQTGTAPTTTLPGGDPQLLAKLKNKDSDLRREAVAAIQKLNPDGLQGLIPDIIVILDDPKDWTREEAVKCLGGFGSGAKAAIPRLTVMLKQQLNDAEDGKPDNFDQTARALGQIAGGNDADTAALLKDAKSDKEGRKLTAVLALAALAEANRFALRPKVDIAAIAAALTESLETASPLVQRAILAGLKSIGRKAAVAGPAVAKFLKDRSVYVRCVAAGTLGEIGSRYPLVVKALVEALEDKDEGVRYAVLNAVWSGHCDDKSLLQPLIKSLSRASFGMACAVLALGEMGDDAAPAVPALCELLVRESKDSDEETMLEMAQQSTPSALGKIVGKDPLGRSGGAISTLESGAGGYEDPLKYKEHVTQKEVKLAASALAKALSSPDQTIARDAARALAQIGPHAKDATDSLRKALGHESAEVRENAAMALEYIGPEAKGAVPELLVAMKDPKSNVRGEAIRAMARVGRESKEATAALIERLADEEAPF